MIKILSFFTFIFLVGCTHMRPIENVPTPLKIDGANVPTIDSFKLKLNIVTPGKTSEKIDVDSLYQRISEAFSSKGITQDAKSPNYLILDVSRFMVIGGGMIFCQSVVEMTARAKIKGKVLSPKRFYASRDGHFCVFGNSTERMKEQTKESLEQVLSDIAHWMANS